MITRDPILNTFRGAFRVLGALFDISSKKKGQWWCKVKLVKVKFEILNEYETIQISNNKKDGYYGKAYAGKNEVKDAGKTLRIALISLL